MCFYASIKNINSKAKLSKVFLDLLYPDSTKHRMIFELRNDIVPKTCRNFELLCTGAKGHGYKGTKIDRIIPGFVCQGGDTEGLGGRGGKAAESHIFPDENFELKHCHRGLLSMCNYGANTNANDYHVVFGRLINGYKSLDKIQKFGTYSGKTLGSVKIVDSGIVTN